MVVNSPNANSLSLSAYRSINFLASVWYFRYLFAIGVLPGLISTVIGSTLAGWSLPRLIRSVSLYSKSNAFSSSYPSFESPFTDPSRIVSSMAESISWSKCNFSLWYRPSFITQATLSSLDCFGSALSMSTDGPNLSMAASKSLFVSIPNASIVGRPSNGSVTSQVGIYHVDLRSSR